MDYYLESCRRNPSIDWLFFTDCGKPDNSPENVQFIDINFRDYCAHVSYRLGIIFNPDSSYKLCDIKPALGYIHAEHLCGYDFWAFGDIDVVYGDLRSYFTNERLASKDLFATHQRRISGHLCLLRNNETMRSAFKKIPRWQQRYADPQHQALDEGAFSRLFIRHKNWPEGLRRFAARFNAWNKRSEFVEAHSTFTLLPNGSRIEPDCWFWRDGRLTNSCLGQQELPYLHFMIWKNKNWKGRPACELSGPADLLLQPGWKISEQGWQAFNMEEP